jgi:hypothetical protein
MPFVLLQSSEVGLRIVSFTIKLTLLWVLTGFRFCIASMIFLENNAVQQLETKSLYGQVSKMILQHAALTFFSPENLSTFESLPKLGHCASIT